MKTVIKEITPQWASKILETRNPSNRNLSQAFVERLARDIKNNAFITTHQGLGFSENGDLLDGQHRLAAIKLANKPVKMMVTTGIPSTFKLNGTSINTFEAIDSGKTRSVGQMLALRGWKNCNNIAATARALANVFLPDAKWLAITTPQTEKILYRFGKDINHVVQFSRSGICRPPSGSLAAIAFYRSVSQEKADSFLDACCTLENVTKGSPAYALASWIKHHPGWNSSLVSTRVTANALMRWDRKQSVEKLYANDDAIRWLKSINNPGAEYISQLMAI